MRGVSFPNIQNDQTYRRKLCNVSRIMYVKDYARISARGQETMLTRQVVIIGEKAVAHAAQRTSMCRFTFLQNRKTPIRGASVVFYVPPFNVLQCVL